MIIESKHWDGKWHQCSACKIVGIDHTHLFCGCDAVIIPWEAITKEDLAFEIKNVEQIFDGEARVYLH